MRPAYLVEGDLEKEFISASCSNSVVRRIIPNGTAVCVKVIADRIATQYRILDRLGCAPVIAILDRERRLESCDEFRVSIETELREKHQITDLVIGVCDCKIENWILADPATVGMKSLPDPEGKNGKQFIRNKLGEYHETTVGVKLLKKARPSEMRRNSPSFDAFYQKIAHLPCWWIER